MVLYIVNGSVLKTYLAAKCEDGQKIIAFNESMITGKCGEDIFSDSFFRQRAENLQIAYEQYDAVTVAELDELLHSAYDEIILWFDADMFCQMNVLTLCAYLDAVKYRGRVQLYIVRQDFWQCAGWQDIVIKSYPIELQGYHAIYQEVLCGRQAKEKEYPVFAELQQGIRLYANYISPHGDIRSAIARLVKENRSKQFIIKEISEQYPQYGIGDYNIQLLCCDIK